MKEMISLNVISSVHLLPGQIKDKQILSVEAFARFIAFNISGRQGRIE